MDSASVYRAFLKQDCPASITLQDRLALIGGRLPSKSLLTRLRVHGCLDQEQKPAARRASSNAPGAVAQTARGAAAAVAKHNNNRSPTHKKAADAANASNSAGSRITVKLTSKNRLSADAPWVLQLSSKAAERVGLSPNGSGGNARGSPSRTLKLGLARDLVRLSRKQLTAAGLPGTPEEMAAALRSPEALRRLLDARIGTSKARIKALASALLALRSSTASPRALLQQFRGFRAEFNTTAAADSERTVTVVRRNDEGLRGDTTDSERTVTVVRRNDKGHSRLAGDTSDSERTVTVVRPAASSSVTSSRKPGPSSPPKKRIQPVPVVPAREQKTNLGGPSSPPKKRIQPVPVAQNRKKAVNVRKENHHMTNDDGDSPDRSIGSNQSDSRFDSDTDNSYEDSFIDDDGVEEDSRRASVGKKDDQNEQNHESPVYFLRKTKVPAHSTLGKLLIKTRSDDGPTIEKSAWERKEAEVAGVMQAKRLALIKKKQDEYSAYLQSHPWDTAITKAYMNNAVKNITAGPDEDHDDVRAKRLAAMYNLVPQSDRKKLGMLQVIQGLLNYRYLNETEGEGKAVKDWVLRHKQQRPEYMKQLGIV